MFGITGKETKLSIRNGILRLLRIGSKHPCLYCGEPYASRTGRWFHESACKWNPDPACRWCFRRYLPRNLELHQRRCRLRGVVVVELGTPAPEYRLQRLVRSLPRQAAAIRQQKPRRSRVSRA